MKSFTDQDYRKVMSNRMEHSGAHGNNSMCPNSYDSFPSNGRESTVPVLNSFKDMVG